MRRRDLSLVPPPAAELTSLQQIAAGLRAAAEGLERYAEERRRETELPEGRISAKEFARINGLSQQTVSRLVANGTVPAIRIGHGIRIDLADARRFAATRSAAR